MKKELFSALDTPCIVVDMPIVRKNIERMQKNADGLRTRLRPHIKTHKMPPLARMQIEAGADGITCAKVSEAESMADGGIKDIFIAYPLVGEKKLARALKLNVRIDRLILAVDSEAGARALNAAARDANQTIEVRIEIDTGKKRTGVTGEHALALAKAVSALPNLRLTGIYTFKSLMLKGETTTDIAAAAQEEGEIMRDVAEVFRSAGIYLKDISAGSSPTGIAVAMTGLVSEIRPGTYIFGDCTLMADGLIEEKDIAARLYATVVSVSNDHAVIDGGTKTFPTDTPIHQPPYEFDTYAYVVNRPDLKLTRMNEEHGMLTSENGKMNLSVGDVLELLPLHICTAINLQNDVYLLDDGGLTREKVAARGMLV